MPNSQANLPSVATRHSVIAIAALLGGISMHPAHAAHTCAVPAPAGKAMSVVVARRVPVAARAGVVFIDDTIFVNGFDCKTGGPYGGGESSGSGGSVTATIIDQNNAAVSGQPTFICGLNICTASHLTDSGGNVGFSTSLTITRPAFRFGDAIHYPTFAVPLPINASTSFGTLLTGIFPALGSGAALSPGTDAVSGDVTFSISPGAQVSIDTLTYSTSDEQKLRTVRIPVTAASAALLPCPSCGFELLYGLAPAETTTCPAAKLSVVLPHAVQSPNDFGWPPGAIVEFWITTTDVGQTYAPYAGWRLISDGHVSADGASVTTENWGGLNFLENFAVRLKP